MFDDVYHAVHFITTFFQTFIQTFQLNLRNRRNVLFTQRMEDHHFIDTVNEFRTEVMAFDPELVASMEESEMMAFDFSPTASNAELVP